MILAAGGALVVAGCALMLLGIFGLGRSFAVPPGPGADAQLVTAGIYGRARHPIFGAWILMGWGFGLAFSPWGIPVAGLLTELFGKSVLEERFLAATYPDYPQYRGRVPRRLLPRLRGIERQGRRELPRRGSTADPRQAHERRPPAVQ